MKLAILGNSHAACVLLAHREDNSLLGDDITPTFFASSRRSMGDFKLRGDTLYATSDNLKEQIGRTSDGLDRIEIKTYDAFFLIGMRYAIPRIARSYSTGLASRALQTMISDAELWTLARKLRHVTGSPIFCAHQPLRAQTISEDQAYHTYDNILEEIRVLTHDLNIVVSPQPRETRDTDLSTHHQFTTGSKRLNTGGAHSETDLSHMNSAYGAIHLRHLRTQLEAIPT